MNETFGNNSFLVVTIIIIIVAFFVGRYIVLWYFNILKITKIQQFQLFLLWKMFEQKGGVISPEMEEEIKNTLKNNS